MKRTKLVVIAMTLLLGTVAVHSDDPNFHTCRHCTQIYETPCLVLPESPVVKEQCGSEDWFDPNKCKDFFIVTYACANNKTFSATVIESHPLWFCIDDTNPSLAACQQ